MQYYNIYTYITDKEFSIIEKRLIILEDKILNKVKSLGWNLTMPISKNDALIVDLIKDDKPFRGNMGITYNDKPGGQVFSFYITKSYDEEMKRYFVKNTIYEDRELSFYEENIDLIVEEALNLYGIWDIGYINENNM